MANLCFLPVWDTLLSGSFFVPSCSTRDCAAVVLNVLLLAALLTAARRLAVRYRWASYLDACLRGFVTLAIAAMAVLTCFRVSAAALTLRLANLLGGTVAVYFGVAMLALAALVLVASHRRLAAGLQTVLLIFAPLVPITFFQAAWLGLRSGNGARADVLGFGGPNTSSAGRVLWLLFDEWDQRTTFVQRPAALKLPEIDRLVAQAIYCTDAYPPGNETLSSIPSLLSGRQVSQYAVARPHQLLITFAHDFQPADWRTLPSIFDKARQAGVPAAVVGWYIPYCELFGRSLASCSWQPWPTLPIRRRSETAGIMLDQVRSLSPWSRPFFHLAKYQLLLADAKEAAASPRLRLIFVHWPVPHFPAIYDRARKEFTTFPVRIPQDWYLENLALVDRTLGDLRTTMQSAGTWENTTILVTSDHSLRVPGKQDHRVPFILKMAGQQVPLVYSRSFNTIITHELLLALLQGQLAGVDDVSAWIDHHRSVVGPPNSARSSSE